MLEQSFKSYNSIKIWCTVTAICLMKCQILFLEKNSKKNKKQKKTCSVCFLLQMNTEIQTLVFQKASGLFGLTNCMYTYAAIEGMCIKIH